MRLWIARLLWNAVGSLGISLIAGLLALVLHAAGDETGATAVRGVLIVAVSVFGICSLSLVVLLAAMELMRPVKSDHESTDPTI